ncbi:MAG: hypothetical protein ABEN55_09855, partial [Bradymonadaceae bacterium]
HGLPRRIEYMLWAGEMTEGRIRQALSDRSEAEVDAALEKLVSQQRVVVNEDSYTKTYAVPEQEFRLYANNWVARIDGLNNLLSNLTDAVVGRFFEDDDWSFARTLNFRIREADIPELHEMYEEQIFETLARLEQKTTEAEDSEVVDMSLSTLWAPTGLSESNEE